MRRSSASESRAGPTRPAPTSISRSSFGVAIGTDPLQVDDVLATLVEIDWVGRLEEGGNARYVMLCDPAATTVEPLVARMLLDPSPDLAPVWQRAGFGRLRLAEILAAPAASA